jgi:hypothetical protein
MSEEIKLKIQGHYQQLSIFSLYHEWCYNKLKDYQFSDSQLARIKKAFKEYQDAFDLIRNENLDVYTDEDFLPDNYTNKNTGNDDYYQHLLDLLNDNTTTAT